MQTLTIGAYRAKLAPTRNVGDFQAKLAKCNGKSRRLPLRDLRTKSGFPVFTPGMSTAEYVKAYSSGDGSQLKSWEWAQLNDAPCTLYSGEDTCETLPDGFDTWEDFDAAQSSNAATDSAPANAELIDAAEPVAQDDAIAPAIDAVKLAKSMLLARFGVTSRDACAHIAGAVAEFALIDAEVAAIVACAEPDAPAPSARAEPYPGSRVSLILHNVLVPLQNAAPDGVPSVAGLESEAARLDASAAILADDDYADDAQRRCGTRIAADYREVARSLRELAEIERDRIADMADDETAPDACRHPPARLYSWRAFDPDGVYRLQVACCDCGDVLVGGATSDPQPTHSEPVDDNAPAPIDGLDVAELGADGMADFERAGGIVPPDYAFSLVDPRALIPGRFGMHGIARAASAMRCA